MRAPKGDLPQDDGESLQIAVVQPGRDRRLPKALRRGAQGSITVSMMPSTPLLSEKICDGRPPQDQICKVGALIKWRAQKAPCHCIEIQPANGPHHSIGSRTNGPVP